MPQQHHIKHKKIRDTYKCCVWKTESKVILVWFPGREKYCKELFINQPLTYVWRGKGHSKSSNKQKLTLSFRKALDLRPWYSEPYSMRGEPWALWTSRSAAYSTRTVPLPACTDRLHKHTAAISQVKEQLSANITLFIIIIYVFYSYTSFIVSHSLQLHFHSLKCLKECIYDAERTHNTTAATNTCADKLLTSVWFLCWAWSSISKMVN